VPSSKTYSGVSSDLGYQNYTALISGIVFYVDNTNSSCSDLNSGVTTSKPFCTIGKGAEVALQGNIVRVLAGTYAERVVPQHQGSAGNPITFSALPGVTVTGDGSGTGSAFRLTNTSYITIDGFGVSDTTEDGIYVYGSNHITVSNNHVSSVGSIESGKERSGIMFNATTDSTISGNTTDHNSLHGIMLSGSCSNITVSNNTTYANASVTTRVANGILVNNSSGNTIIHNVAYANEDTGLGFYAGSTNNQIVGNLTYGNGDHGIDLNGAPNNIIVSNSVQGNVTTGINLEGDTAPGSGGSTVQNNISTDNGLDSPSGLYGNIRVDIASQSGTTLDYNMVYRDINNAGKGTMITWGITEYQNMAQFHDVTGQESHGLQMDPMWVSPATPALRPPSVNVGDYHLKAGSPAIDSANSDAANQPLLDIEGNQRADEPDTLNSGAGTRAYDDRGAYEYQPPNQPNNYQVHIPFISK
jgi:parallel beta-helix repeat protein